METTLATVKPEIELLRGRQLSAASPAIAAQRPLCETVDAFLTAAARKSANTRRAYLGDVGLFLQWLDGERGGLGDAAWRPYARQVSAGRHSNGRLYYRQVWVFTDGPSALLWLVDAAALDSFAAARLAEGDSPRVVDRRLSAVRTFLAVALRDNIVTREQAEQLGLDPYRERRERLEKQVGRRLSVAEVRSLRAAVDTRTNKGKRDLAILDMMLFAGLRRAEVAGLTAANIQRDNGRAWLSLEGKGRKRRRIKIHDTLYRTQTTWMDAAGLAFHDSRPLFVSVNKGDAIGAMPIDGSAIERIVAQYGHAAGLGPVSGAGKLAPHDLRRTCARNAYDHGATLLQVQTLLGHSDPKTTARYIGADSDDDNTAVDRLKY